MNCKPNDLAVIVGGAVPENIGRLVKVLEAYREGAGWTGEGFSWWVESEGRPLAFDRTCGMRDQAFRIVARDSVLRPIRPHSGPDEVLQRTGKPEYEEADAITRMAWIRERMEDVRARA